MDIQYQKTKKKSKKSEITITEAMAEAGAYALRNFDPEGTAFKDGAIEVYRIMELARLNKYEVS